LLYSTYLISCFFYILSPVCTISRMIYITHGFFLLCINFSLIYLFVYYNMFYFISITFYIYNFLSSPAYIFFSLFTSFVYKLFIHSPSLFPLKALIPFLPFPFLVYRDFTLCTAYFYLTSSRLTIYRGYGCYGNDTMKTLEGTDRPDIWAPCDQTIRALARRQQVFWFGI
jgi:hypothetical protein